MHDEWIAGDRRYLSEESMVLMADGMDTGTHAALESGESSTEDHLKPHHPAGLSLTRRRLGHQSQPTPTDAPPLD